MKAHKGLIRLLKGLIKAHKGLISSGSGSSFGLQQNQNSNKKTNREGLENVEAT